MSAKEGRHYIAVCGWAESHFQSCITHTVGVLQAGHFPSRTLAIAQMMTGSCHGRSCHWLMSASTVVIVDTDDVILSEVATRLHLDDFQRDTPWIFHAMNSPKRDVDRLVLR